MSSILAIARKEGRDMAREKTLAAAIAVQFVIAAFSALITVGLAGLYDPDALGARPTSQVAYVGHGAETALPDLLAAERNIQLQPMSQVAAMAAFGGGSIDAVVDEQVAADGSTDITLVIPGGEIEGVLLMTQVKGVLQTYEAGLRAQYDDRITHIMVTLPERDYGAPLPYTFLYGILVPLLVLTPAFVSGAIAGDSLARDLHTGTLTVLRAAPVSTRRILLAKLLVPIVLAPLQLLLWAGLLRLNGAPIRFLPVLLVISVALAALWAGVSFAVSARARHPGAAQAGYALSVLAIGAASLWMPRDILNTIAVTAGGYPDTGAWLSLIVIIAAAAAVLPIGMLLATRRIERGQ